MDNTYFSLNKTVRFVLLALLLAMAGLPKIWAQRNITFADANVKAICVANWDTNGDGELSYAEAAAVTSLGTVFRFNHNITSFNELQYFTGLTTITSRCFYSCSSLISVNIPETVKTIWDEAFGSCSSLTSILIPNAVTYIGTSPFSHCPNLEQISVGSGNRYFDSREGCNAIIKTSTNTLIAGCKNTIIPNTVTSIDSKAFYFCTNLSSITIPNSILSIGSEAFTGCSNLISIVIPSSVTSIANNNPFSHCSNLEQIAVETGNPNYDSRNGSNAIIETVTNTLISGCKNTMISDDIEIIEIFAFNGQSDLISIDIPNSVTRINSYAFASCDKLASVTFGNSITTIGDGAFKSCYKLSSITLPSSLSSLGTYAFYYCIGLESITVLAETPPTLGDYVFENVSTTIPVYVPCSSKDTYSSENWGGFNNFLGLCAGEVTVSVHPEGCGMVTGTGFYEGGDTCVLTAIPNVEFAQFLYWTKDDELVSCDEVYSFVVTGDVSYMAHFGQSTVIGDGGTATNMYLPSYSHFKYSLAQQIYTHDEIGGPMTIHSMAFYNGGATKTRNIDIYLVHTDKTVFENSKNWIPVSESDLVFSGVVTLETDCWTGIQFDKTFSYDGVSNLALITDDNSGEYTNSPNMACRVFDSNGKQAIRIYSDGTNYNPNNPSTYSGTLLSVKNQIKLFADISPSNLNISFADAAVKALCVANWDTNEDGELSYAEATDITDLGEVFKQNNMITSFDELQYFTGLTSIGDEAFYCCSELTSIVIPNSIVTIGDYALANCSHLDSLTVLADIPPIVSSNTFSAVNSTIPVHVPCYSLEDYETALGWSGFTNIQGMDCPSYEIAATANPDESGEVSGTGTYSQWAFCTLTASADEGYTFVNWTEDGNPVSTDDPYMFRVTGDRTLVANFSLNSYEIAASTYPIGGGTITGCDTYYHGTSCTLTVTSNPNYIFLNWTENGVEVSTDSIYSFIVDSDRTLVANFDYVGSHWLPESANYAENMALYGVIQIDGVEQLSDSLEVGAFCNEECRGSAIAEEFHLTHRYLAMMTVFGDIGDIITFKLYDHHTKQELELASPAPIIFDENGYGTPIEPYILNFTHSVTQTRELIAGWNWYSTYIEQGGIDGLTMLENSLGEAGVRIQGRNGYADQFEYEGTYYWYGTLNALANEDMYMIRTNAACDAVLAGEMTAPTNHSVTINPGWNWIGFPLNQSVSVATALFGFTPESDDVIKGRNGSASYVADYNLWYGTLNTLEPGQGYMYKSNSGSVKTLTFQMGRGEEIVANVISEHNFFTPNDAEYANNMLMIAIINMDGEELRSDAYELAAFVGDECRGSVKLMYVAPLDRYVAFLTIFGDEAENLRFVLTDGTETRWSDDEMVYASDALIGTLSNPATLHFGYTGINENEVNAVVYPNPTNNLLNVKCEGISRVEVVNVLGQLVMMKEVKADALQIDMSSQAAGVYMLRVFTDNGTITKQIIKNK
jgi:hypothetical protein